MRRLEEVKDCGTDLLKNSGRKSLITLGEAGWKETDDQKNLNQSKTGYFFKKRPKDVGQKGTILTCRD